MDNRLPDEVTAHYADGYEAERLARGAGQIELARTQELLRRFLPPAPAVVLDVGGGPGRYALWLARLGYTVHLIDALPLHIELARDTSAQQSDAPLASATLGDARTLDWPDAGADAALLMGPLYHLTDRADRIAALREAGRVLQRGGVALVVGISRFASTMDGLRNGLFADPEFERIVAQDLRGGQHRNLTNHPSYFTTAYFHLPDELRAEVEEAGLRHEATLPVEGPAWLIPRAFENWDDAVHCEQVLAAIWRIESEPSLLGVSAHLLAVARKEK
jgi:ubiquinone/menaquinone biosynthesis C-methylase UbiE